MLQITKGYITAAVLVSLLLLWYMKRVNKAMTSASQQLINVQLGKSVPCLLAGESNPALPRSGDEGFRHWQAGVSDLIRD